MPSHAHVLVLAIGNSTCKLAVMREYEAIELHSFPTHADVDDVFLTRWFATIYDRHAIAGSVICSVVPLAAARIEALRARTDPKPSIVVDPRRPLWFGSHYETMDTLGADRWCAVIAAREQYGYPSVVIDCGTAITINVIDPEGDFAGGNILPGITTSFEALNQRTAQLPDARDTVVPPLIGANTHDAIRAGVLRTIGKGVEGVIAEIEAEYQRPSHVVLTGGDASMLFLDPERERVVDPDLVLKGAGRYMRVQLSGSMSEDETLE